MTTIPLFGSDGAKRNLRLTDRQVKKESGGAGARLPCLYGLLDDEVELEESEESNDVNG